MAYAYIAECHGAGINTYTSGSQDSTGANHLVVVRSYFGTTVGTLSDSKSNTWSQLTKRELGGGASIVIEYCQGGTVGSGHTFTVTGLTIASAGYMMSFSGAAASPFDQENGTAGGGFSGSAQPGSITPGEDNELIVAGFSFGSGATISNADLDLLLQTNFAGGTNFGIATGYKIQTTAAAINPNFTFTGSQAGAVGQASFKAAAGGGGGGIAIPVLTRQYRQRWS